MQSLTALIQIAHAPAELEPYRTYVLGLCFHLGEVLDRNLADLERGPEGILEDILSNTQLATRLAQLLSARIASRPCSEVLRAASQDA